MKGQELEHSRHGDARVVDQTRNPLACDGFRDAFGRGCDLLAAGHIEEDRLDARAAVGAKSLPVGLAPHACEDAVATACKVERERPADARRGSGQNDGADVAQSARALLESAARTIGEGSPTQVTQSWCTARVAPTWRSRRDAGWSGNWAAPTSTKIT
jgi:hypothetical protein